MPRTKAQKRRYTPSAFGAYQQSKRRKYATTTIPKYYQPAAEKKWFDTSKTATSISALGTVLNSSLNLIPAGTDETERIGKKCNVTSLHVRGQFEQAKKTNLDQAENKVRIIFYVDKQANGAAATVTDILQTGDVNSFRNLSNINRFNILLDRTYDINASGAAFTGTTVETVSCIKSFYLNTKCNIPLEFSGATGALTELASNNIGCIALAENNQTNVLYTCRLRFIG